MNHNIHPNTTIWCDMDGVIAVYDVNGFRGSNPPFLVQNSHYFLNCTPDTKIIKALQLLHDVYHIKLKIISNINETLKQEHTSDKSKWLKQHVPFINVDKDYHAIIVSKTDYVQQKKKQSLQKTDILISDYNNDLNPWSIHGGTGIKYANGINNPNSYNGLHIPEHYTTKQIANYLIDIIYNINN